MANNRIQVKRTSVSTRTPNTTNSGNNQYITAGELALNMADGILYSSNGSALLEVGSNNTSQNISTNNLTVGNTLYVIANGNVGIGNSSPSAPFTIQKAGSASTIITKFVTEITGTAGSLFDYEHYNSVDGNGSAQIRFNKANGTVAAPTIVGTDRATGRFGSRGYDGTAFYDNALIRMAVDGAPGTGSMPGRLEFWTTPSGSTTLVERMRITSTGNVGISNTAPADKFSVNGTSYFGANVTLTAALIANGGAGSAGQVLHSNGTAIYWAADDNTNTTYDLLTVANTEVNKAIIRLQDSGNANDDVFIIGANGINTSSNSTGAYAYAVGGNTVTVNTTGIHVNTNLSITSLNLSGNLTVSGGVTVIGANTLSIVDNFIYLNSNNTTQNVDLGFAGNYNDGTYRHAGFFRDATDGYWKVFDGYLPEPDASVNIDTSNTSFNIAGFWSGNTRVGNTTVYTSISNFGINFAASGYEVNPTGARFGFYNGGGTPQTYMQMPAGGEIVFWNAGTAEVMRITGAGNVGIGLGNPTASLHIKGPIGDGKISIQPASGGRAYNLESIGGSHFRIYDASAGLERLRIDFNGNVGIGTNSPSALLDVLGYSYTGTDTNNSFFVNSNSSVVTVGAAGRTTFSTSALRFITSDGANALERMRLDSSGRLLLGLTSAAADSAAIISGTNFSGRALTLTGSAINASSAGQVSLTLAHFGDGSNPEVGSVIRSIEEANNTLAGSLTFEVFGGAARSEAMRITSAGNVGIGETNPQRKLTVRGDSNAALTVAAFYNADTTNNNGTVFSFRTDTTGTGAATFQEFAGVSATYEQHDHATRSGRLNFFTVGNGSAATVRMTIANNGNVGVGTTTPSSLLHINANNPRFTAQSGFGTGGWQQDGDSGNALIVTDVGAITFKTGVTALGNWANTGSERARITSAGELLVGTTTTSKSLTVKGTGLAIVAGGTQNAGNEIYFYRSDLLNMAYIGWQTPTSANSPWLFNSVNGNPIVWASGGTERMRLTDAGSLGIGTASPSSRLHVTDLQAIITAQSTSTGGSAAKLNLITNWTGTDYTASIENDWSGAGFVFKTSRDLTNSQGGFVFQSAAGSSSMVIRTNSGNVGIGTDSPAARLHVKQSNDNNLSGIRVSRSANDVQYGLLSNHSGATFIGTVDANNAGNQILVFNRSSDGSTFTESMRIAANGNVGIGTTNPANKLQVDGNVTFNGARPIFFDPALGSIKIKGDVGGWETGLFFLGSSATLHGGFGALGIGDALTYYFVGSSYSNAAIYVLPNNNVGIGVSNPSNKLHVLGTGQFGTNVANTTPPVGIFLNAPGTGTGDASPSIKFDVGGGGGGASIYTTRIGSAGGNLIFTTDNTSGTALERMRIDSSGTLTLTGTTDKKVSFVRSGANTFSIEHDTARIYFWNATTSNNVLTFTNDSRVGVGTPNPAGKFSVLTTSGTGSTVGTWGDTHAIFGPNVAAANGAALGLTYNTTDDRAEILSLAPNVSWKLLQIYSAGLILSATGGTESLRIQNDGNIGIGVSTALTHKVNLPNNTAIGFHDNAGTSRKVLEYNSSNQILIGSAGANINDITFGTNGLERARFDINGNFGLGLTPSAWGSNYRAIQVNSGGGGVVGSGRGINIVNNAYANNTNWRYFASAAAARYNIDGGNHAWHVAASGTADANIAFTEAMTLAANGNLGIGTTTPSVKLDVNGEIRALSISGYNLSNNAATIDTGLTPTDFTILEAFGSANPNADGSSTYRDPIHLYIYKGTGWNGSAVTDYVYAQSVAPPARSAFPSGSMNSGNDNMSVVWVKAGVESDSCPTNDATYSLRIKISNYMTTSYFSLRIVRRF